MLFAVGPITTIKQGTKDIGLGLTGVAYYADVTSLYYNPALLVLNDRNTLQAEYSYNENKLFNQISVNYMRFMEKKIVMGLNFLYYNPPSEIIRDEEGNILRQLGQVAHQFNGTASVKVSKIVNLGVSFKVLNNNYDEESYTSVAMDVGALYVPFKKAKTFNLGLNVMNLLSTRGKLNQVEIKEPFNLKIGASYRWHWKQHNFLTAVDVNTKKEYFPQYGVGLEYTFKNLFSVRLGYNDLTQFTLGAGFVIYPVAINYSFEKQDQTKIVNHIFSATYHFKPELNAEMREQYYNKGIMHYNDFKFEKAFEFFSAIYESDKYYRETEYYYELLYKRVQLEKRLQKQRFVAAEGLYQEAITHYKNNNNTEAINKLIECLRKNNNHQDAKKLLNRIRGVELARVNNEKSRVREKEGDYYFLLNNFPAALVEYEEALKLNPDNETLHIKIKDTKEQLKKLDIDVVSMNLYKEALQLYEKGDYGKAISKWQEVLAANPDFINAKVQIQKAEQMQRQQEDQRFTSRVVQDRIKDLIKVINYKIRKKNYAQALFSAEELLEIAPGHKEGVNLKLQIINKINDKKVMDAQERQQKEQESLVQGIEAYKRGELDKALYHLSVVVALNPVKGSAIKELNVILSKMSEFESSGVSQDSSGYQLISRHYERGMTYYKKNNFEAAALEWKRVLKMVPGNREIAEKLENTEEKVRQEKEEKLAIFHLKRAQDFLKENKKDLAIAEAKRILGILPNNLKAQDIVKQCLEGLDKEKSVQNGLEKANTLAKDSKYQEAIQELKVVLILESDNKLALQRLQEYESNLTGIEKSNEAKDNLDMALKYFENENFKDARRMVQKVLDKDRKNVRAKELLDKINQIEVEIDINRIQKKKVIELYNKGVSYYTDEKYNECINTMKEILAKEPDNMGAIKFIEKSKQKLNEKESAKVAQKDKKVDKQLIWQYYLKGINYYTSGDIDNAIKEWQSALQLDPENKKIKQSLERAYAKKAVLE